MELEIPHERQPLINVFIHRNSQINLSAIRTPQDIYTKHILDSLELNKVIDLTKLTSGNTTSNKNTTLIDIGTGGGFPLLPLATTYPDINCVGLDARKKKCHAIDDMAHILGLENVITAWSRAEEYDVQADIITSRAVTYADKLFHRSLPLVKKGGYLVLYKLFTTEEDNLILSLIRQYNLTLIKLHHYLLPNDETERIIYIIKKQ